MAKQPMTVETIVPESFTAKVHGVDFLMADLRSLPEASLRKIFEYGAQRIMNDSTASGKTDDERLALAQKRWDNLKGGIIRATGARTGDPVKRRALELAEARVKAAPKFIAWLAEAKLKMGDKEAVAKVRELAEKQISVEGNPFIAQAKIDVEAAKSLSIDDLDIE